MTELVTAPIDPANLNELEDELSAAGLPVADLGEPDQAFFRIHDDAGTVGFGGLEGQGADRMLRSITVVAGRRSSGLGSTILARIECEARRLGVERLHLLTNTAARFFRTNGYSDADRHSAPVSIAASREFTTLCPASATYLVKAL